MQISPRPAHRSFDLVTPGSRRGCCWAKNVMEVTSAGYYRLVNSHKYVVTSKRSRKSVELLLWIKKYTLTSFIVLGMLSEGNVTKNGEPSLVSPSWQCSSTPVDFGQGFISKEQRDNPGAFPIIPWPSSSWIYLFLDWSQHWRDGAFVNATDISKNATEEMKRLSQYMNISNTFPVAGRSVPYSCTRGLFWRKCSLNDCTILNFSEVKWFRNIS
jgi:hypothetical protein